MRANVDSVMWDGTRFKDIAVLMSTKAESFGDYIDRMAKDNEWFDAAALHALGCVCTVAVQIWQEGLGPALVGVPYPGGCSEEPFAMIPVCMVNDKHF